MDTNEKSTKLKVLLFPWLGHGHVSPYFELAKKLIEKNFQVFFCSTAINLNSIKKSCNENSSNQYFSMEFIELNLPEMPELPPHYHTTKGLPPHLANTLNHAFYKSKTNFFDIFNNVKPDLLIFDCYQSWAADFASLHKVPSVNFLTSGAATNTFFYHGNKYGYEDGFFTYPFPEIFIRPHTFKKMIATVNSDAQLEVFHDSPFNSLNVSNEIVLIKSSREFEGKYLDYFSSLTGKEIVPLGPLVHEPKEIEGDYLEILDWLNKKNPSSVVFISFGSEIYLSKEEIEEIAHGLELSKVNFIWIIRFSKGTSMKTVEAVPEGFLKRTKDQGIVVEGWAPQAKILGHPSIGGFMSHCGWGSITESLYYGVPVISMAMKFDQPTNERLLVEIGVGMEVLKDENGEFRREEIARVVEEVVLKGSCGNDDLNFKRKARELSLKLKMEQEELIDVAIDKLRMICSTKM